VALYEPQDGFSFHHLPHAIGQCEHKFCVRKVNKNRAKKYGMRTDERRLVPDTASCLSGMFRTLRSAVIAVIRRDLKKWPRATAGQMIEKCYELRIYKWTGLPR
jgi:hypothetical protein